ncbi:hypothetical protein ACTWP5_26760 [Streptomyces sp. 4N509B]|uniref:hypothetical protein n=1 Tax=Streptomyces sp. 4N509B TaxID=3457413 RepID=UPI003FD608B3
MNAPGTIERPAPYGPDLHTHMTLLDTLLDRQTDAVTGSEPDAALPRRKQNRNRTLHLINEAMARSHMEDLRREAESQRRAHRLILADRLERRSRRLQQRAERASQRARRAVAQALIP